MRKHGYQNYYDNEVLAATPWKLIQLLYGGALESIASARESLRSGNIRARSQAITKAMRILTELSRCLNHEAGGELSRNLARVYGYVIRLLIEANTRQVELPLAEAERLLSALAEAWKSGAPAQKEHSAGDAQLTAQDPAVPDLPGNDSTVLAW
jgi:flagellar secretion chaperone FliS